jgi:hypothetical protein
VNIEGDDYEISPEVWEVFEGWWGDKAYRQADMVEAIEKKVREAIKERLRPALETLISDLDYDTHKNLLRGEDDGEDHYPEKVEAVAKALGL